MSERKQELDVAGKLGKIEAIVQNIANSNTKIMIALIGVIAAQVGLKFVGSPPWVIIASYVSFFASAVLLTSLVIFWKRMSLSMRLVRITFALFIIFSVTCRVIVFHETVTLTPVWYTPIVDGFFTLLCLLLIWRSFDSK